VPIILQYLEACQHIDAIQLNATEPDRFIWCWTASGQFSSKSAYHAMFAGESIILGVKELWKSRVLNRCRFFIRLSQLGRSRTSDRLFRHGIRSNDVCALCSLGTRDDRPFALSICLQSGSVVQCVAASWLASPGSVYWGFLRFLVASGAQAGTKASATDFRLLRYPGGLVHLAWKKSACVPQ
jgi:hypothetical protein